MRSIVKAVTWRIIAALTTLIVVYLLTGDMGSAGATAAIAGTIKMVLYVLHDNAYDTFWTNVKAQATLANPPRSFTSLCRMGLVTTMRKQATADVYVIID